MNNSSSQTPEQAAPEPTDTNVVTEAKPDAAAVKAKTVVKASRSEEAPKAKRTKPVAEVAKPAAVKAQATPKPINKTIPETTPVDDTKLKSATKSAKLSTPAKAAKSVGVVKPSASKVPAKAEANNKNKESKEKNNLGKKPKLVRDSFTFPKAEYDRIGILKQRALKAGHDVKKSELLRAGLAALSELSDAALLKALSGIDKLKTGRPAK